MSDENGGSTALAELEDQSARPLDQRTPVMDRIEPRMLELIQKSRFKGLNGAETGMALELAVHYGLDPFAGEIWATRSQGKNGAEGQLLIMIGRDGLRKVVNRNKLDMDGDVHRQNDIFKVVRNPDRTRTVEHTWEGSVEERGPIVGAWAEVWDREGKQRGFFYAPMQEYRPTSEAKLKYSPWGSQESVMILAAAERQAARQATPLSGLLMEGEMDLNEERAAIDAGTAEDDAAVQAVIDSLAVPEELRDRLYDAVAEANRVAPNSWSAMTLQVQVAGHDGVALEADIDHIQAMTAELRARKEKDAERAAALEPFTDAPEVADAEVVPDGDAERVDRLRNAIADLEAALEDPEVPDREQLQEKLKAAARELAELTGEE